MWQLATSLDVLKQGCQVQKLKDQNLIQSVSSSFKKGKTDQNGHEVLFLAIIFKGPNFSDLGFKKISWQLWFEAQTKR
jgi:hypothetical protein